MAGGFGFPSYPQRGTPRAQDVGAALEARAQAPTAGAPASGPPMAAPAMAQEGDDMAPIRLQGAVKMGAPGQMNDDLDRGDGEHSANALNVAVGEALTRMGGGYATNPNPHKDRARNVRLLQQLGLSETEATLLAQTGGI